MSQRESMLEHTVYGDILRRQNRIMASRTLEGNDVLNDINRELISIYAEIEGSAFLGRINSQFGFSKDEIIGVYTGQMIYNFEYDFCIPAYDALLTELISEWRTSSSVKKLNKIHARIAALGGLLFIWS